jgi:catechol 2,3-dioxygenase
MDKNKLPPDIQLGAISLTFSDLQRAIDFYLKSIGLEFLESKGNEAFLGVNGRELVHLVGKPGAVRVPRSSGLYHFALLLPSRQALGNTLHNLIRTETRLTGGADHLVSEALYLDDTEGNGIEIYRDRPREEWTGSDGRLRMDTLPLDFEGVLNEAGGSITGRLPAETKMGHVHLHVAHIDESVTFYRDVVGLDLMMKYGPSAAFLSAGGYHHHIGVNTWAGVGAPPLPPDAVGLRDFVFRLPAQALDALEGRLRASGTPFDQLEDGLYVRDPSLNTIKFI